ncbi:MAG: FRG domain-containing protein [Oscillibacter sp.]|nr:FRG domain-containing protein [Oscillibacter sp.]MEA4994188.1 FRG domain-containing protein [Oscillibacter sp.]
MDKRSMYESIEKNLSDRHWGARAKGTSPGNHPRFYVMDYRGLALATGIIRYTFYKENSQTSIFYRGQRKDWELQASLYRDCKTRQDTIAVGKWREQALSKIEKEFDPIGTDDEREALAQHYGMKTQFLDVVDNIQTALWFAFDNVSMEDPHFDDSVGYIQVIAIPNTETIIDLRHKPSEWLRPHIQQGFAIKRKNPSAQLGSFASFLVATFIISRENLRCWSNYENLPRSYFYPSSALDRGAEYWEKAENELRKAGLSTSPELK